MIDTMRELALLELNHRFGTRGLAMDPLRKAQGKELAPLLVEASENLSKVYLLQADPERPGLVRLWVEQLDEAKRLRLPFNRPSGSQSAAIGPVLKRTYKPKDKPAYGPSPKIQKTTREAFQRLAEDNTDWAAYFRELCRVLFQGAVLAYEGNLIEVGDGKDDPDVLIAAIRLISEKETVFLSVVDSDGRWPGDRPDYQAYLAQELAKIKYVTGEADVHASADCPLCGATGTALYPNALKGAGVNFSNIDRAGAFPGLDTAQAWKAYGLCLDCADLLYIFKNHTLSRFLARIGGEKALLLPALLGNEAGKAQFMEDWDTYVRHLEGDKIGSLERDLMEFFAGQDDAQVVLHILWAKFGQVIEDVQGQINDVLPSRLQSLTRYNKEATQWSHALKPASELDETRFDLSLSVLSPLLHRPGGRKAEKTNASPRLFELKRQLAGALYHGRPLGRVESAFWEEILTTARWYLDDIAESGYGWGLLYQELGGRKKSRYLTLAGWVRHLARFLYYLEITRVLPMEQAHGVFEPEMEKLKPYFQPGSGINSREKAFAFLLGILYGKLLEVQAARGVNVASNALTWLKRLRLSGRDLPALYNKLREKLLAYGTEGSREVRELIHEIGRLGSLLGDRINLDTTPTCYFLLLGQSVTVEVLPVKEKKGETENE